MKAKSFLVFTAIFMATSLMFSCSFDVDDIESIGGASSSSDDASSSSLGNSSSSDGSGSSGGDVAVVTFTDSRDGRVYKSVKINGKTWMAENLNYAGPDGNIGKCYGEDGEVYYDEDTGEMLTLSADEVQANCVKYGRLYDWSTAMSVCPSGWSLPSNADWDALYLFVDPAYNKDALDCECGFSETAGRHLKAKSGWEENGNGTDNFGFAALPGGYGLSNGNFYRIGYVGDWWSSSEKGVEYAYHRGMYHDNEHARWDLGDKSKLFRVRCLQN